MPKSRFQGGFFATILLAVLAAVAVLAGVAAWERSSVSVYVPTPTEHLLLLRAGDVVDSSVSLGASQFEERTEKRIEAFERGVLEYVFSAKETGVEVRTRIIERGSEELAQEELVRIQREFGGTPVDPYAGSLYIDPADVNGIPTAQVFRGKDRFLYVARRGTYVYALETTPHFASEIEVAQAMYAKMQKLDSPGFVLPLRSPRVE